MTDGTTPETNHSHGRDVLRDIAPLGRALRKAIPDVYDGFVQKNRAALGPGALDTKMKQLVALAIGVAQQCDGCIASHARGAARTGATEQEVAEVIGVCILMAGGPATVYGPRALAAFTDFATG